MAFVGFENRGQCQFVIFQNSLMQDFGILRMESDEKEVTAYMTAGKIARISSKK